MKRSAVTIFAVACAAMLVGTSAAVAGPFRGGGGGGNGGGARFGGGGGGGFGGSRMEQRQDMRQQQMQQQQQQQRQGPGLDNRGGRMSPEERQQLREQIREHGPAYRERDRGR